MPATLPAELTLEQYQEASEFIQHHASLRSRVALVLGSGLNSLADHIENPVTLPYRDIPHFPESTVSGHAGQLVAGLLSGIPVMVMQGRFHFYEGYTLSQVTFPVRVLASCGVQTLILTNAAGGLNSNFQVGDVMLIEDHINFPGMAGNNPLFGPNLDEFGPRFPAANRIYTRHLRQLATKIADGLGIQLHRGVYAMVAGPSFETPAEVRFLRMAGADAVGMSTVPEALIAHHAGLEVLAFSGITNVSIDELDAADEPSHADVQEAGAKIVPRMRQLLLTLVKQLATQSARGKK